MRHLLPTLLVLLASSASAVAQLYADFQTTAGSFTCELSYKETPRTVGNFISLAEGSRNWVDARTGLMSTIKPPQSFYKDIQFHRVVNTEGFKIIQAGSKIGDGTDGPGYEFPDEMNLNVPKSFKFDQPYYLAMANSGPNTNGSQFFITGSPIPGLEGKHTVFGRVTTGQSVIDGILEGEVDLNDRPVTDVKILSVQIRRADKAAGKFKASSQKLPTMLVPKVKVAPAPSPANTNRYFFSQGQRSQFLCFATVDPTLQAWQQIEGRWNPPSAYSLRYFDVTYPAVTPITGFRPIVVKYGSDALTPDTLLGWALSLANADGSYLFSFPRNAAPGYLFTPAGGGAPKSGAILSYSIAFEASPHHALAQFELTQSLGPNITARYKTINLQLGFDRKVKTNLHGRCVSKQKTFTILSEETGSGLYFTPLQEVGGDVGFSMVPIK